MRTTIAVLLVLMVAGAVVAGDIGNNVPVNVPPNTWNVEVFMENFNRDIVQESSELNEGDSTFTTAQEERRVVARATCELVPTMRFNVDLGMVKGEGSEGNVPLFGAGARKEVFAMQDYIISAFGQLVYVNGIEYKGDWGHWTDFYTHEPIDFSRGRWKDDREESHIEYGIGAQVDKLWQWPAGFQINTYGGLQLSAFHGDGKETFTYEHVDDGSDWTVNGLDFNQPLSGTYSEKLDFDQDQVFGMFLGATVAKVDLPFSVRFEWRGIDQNSYTIAGGWAF